MEDSSLRILVPDGISVLDAKILPVVSRLDQSPTYLQQLSALQSKIEAAHNAQNLLSAQKERNEFLQDSVKLFITKRLTSDTALDISAGLSLINSANQELEKLGKEYQDLELKMLGYTRDIGLLEKELSTLQQTAAASTLEQKSLTIHLIAGKAYSRSDRLEFSVLYLCGPASWVPHYDLRIQPDQNGGFSAQIDYMADAWQSSGQDWSNVHLSLSTSQPGSISSLPQPFRRVVDRDQPQSFFSISGVSKSKALRSPLKAIEMAADAGFSSSPSVANRASIGAGIEIESLGELSFDHAFMMQHPLNISHRPSEESYHHLFSLEQVSFPVTLFTFSCPSRGSISHLTFLAQYPTGKSPLLPSDQLRIHVEDSFKGQGSMPSVSRGQRFILPLGPDLAVKVNSEVIVPHRKGIEKDQSSWFVVDKHRYEVRTEERLLSVLNTSPLEKFIVITENLPRSADDNLKVESIILSKNDLKTLPFSALLALGKGESFDPNLLTDEDFQQALIMHESSLPKHQKPNAYHCASSGHIYWALWLKSGEKASFSFKFSVTSPDDQPAMIS